jgi:hypothetical protein
MGAAAVYDGKECGMGVRTTIYLREQLQSPRWLMLKVAQPQVPPLKKSETYYVRFCVCPHTTGPEAEKRQKESGDRYGDITGYSNRHKSGLLL